MNSKEVQIVVEPSEGCTYIVLLEVRASGGKEVRALEHAANEDVWLQAHSNG
jgi:hypothetical protein